MKINHIFLFYFLFAFTTLLQAQSQKSPFLFNEFKKGKAVYKNGTVAGSLFNYDLTTGKILFMDNGETMELMNLPTFTHVEIDGRTFLYIKGNDFYEKISLEGINLYVNWNGDIISSGKSVGYGKSQTTSVTQVDQFNREGGNYKIDVDEDFVLLLKNNYYLNIDNKYKRFSNLNSLAKLFKGHEDEIIDGLKNEKLDFKNFEDVKKAVQFCSKYSK